MKIAIMNRKEFAIAHRFTLSIVATLLACICMAVSGCDPRVTNLHIVLPNDFRGEVRIVEDRRAPPIASDEQGRHVFHVADNGTLRVSSFAPFESSHHWSAEFADGQPIPCYPNDRGYSNTAVIFQELGTYSHGNGPEVLRCFVGTDMESRGGTPYYSE